MPIKYWLMFNLAVVVIDFEEFVFDGIQQWTQIVEHTLPEPAGQLETIHWAS